MRKERMAALALVLTLSLPAAAQASPLLYRARDAAGHTIYLLGTMHVGEEEKAALSPLVEMAWEASSALAVEADLTAFQQDRNRVQAYSRALLYGAGETAKTHLSQEVYALGIARLSTPEATLRRLRPAAWVSLAQEQVYATLGLSSDWGMDAVLLNRAYAESKPVYELESVEQQTALMQEMPDAIAEDQLKGLLGDEQTAQTEFWQLYQAWADGDAEAIWALVQAERQQIPADAQDEYAAYDQKMYGDRNRAFAEAALRYLSSGECVLMAFGAAHFPGDDGVVQLLQSAGVSLERIVAENMDE